MFRLKAEEQQIQFTFDVDRGTLAGTENADSVSNDPTIPLYFDRSKLEVIVVNLLANALKYTPAGRGVTLRVSVHGNPGFQAQYAVGALLDHYVQIDVCDEGRGMAPDELDRIFDLYYQASQAETIRLTGSGIGLSLVKQFVERQGGTISVQSQPGRGTTFTVRLPFGFAHLSPADLSSDADSTPVEMPVFVPEAASVSVPAIPLLTQRILIIEDNDEVRSYLTSLFTGTFDVITANDGREGWEQVLHQLPDLVISDIMMPYRDGLELCRLIKQHPKTGHIPVVLLTARVAAAHELEGLETGADDYVGKPFNPSLLIARVNMLLSNRLKLRHYYQQTLLLQPADVVIPDADRIFLEKAMNLVETNLVTPDFSAQWLIREMGMSRSVFFRRLKSTTGQSVIEFINDIRMKRAAQLLSSGGLRVSEVCEMVGLEDLKHFRRAFQQLHGVSPSEYIRQHQPDSAAV
jgi:CheY-like chemotaxis protein/AraC-like DNA-binding protein